MSAIIALFSLVPGVLSILSALTLRWYTLSDATMADVNTSKRSLQSDRY
jgi:GPH family glycoside/pentoside/hexuronide:cation symporter